ncbi:hypothetical protein [Niveispirillum sp.]|uniref:hypothetical protein n=1 Tax=Niveispirillum sp. TaxID=1917217 RepID=UPI001B4E4B92|nr:hypothetical protein [Niveispirillum sp.]MBP7340615.1 hypothetical protein [Niveispirillum sp.]
MAVKFRPLGPPVLLEDAAPPPASNDRGVTGYDIRLGFEWLDTTNTKPQLYRCIDDNPVALRWVRLTDNFDGEFNSTFIGNGGFYATNLSLFNCGFGENALRDVTDGQRNTGIGSNAAANLEDGQRNTAVGDFALCSNAGGNGNTAFGQNAMADNISDYNTAVGQGAMERNSNGSRNVAIGQGAMAYGTSGSYNVVIGVGANLNSTGDGNTVVGHQANAGNYEYCVVLGAYASATKNNQLVLGSSGRPLVTHATAGAVSEYLEVLVNGAVRKIELKAV